MKNIYINTHGNEIPQSYGDWIDLQTAEDFTLNKGEYGMVSLGVSMQLPENHYAMVVSRSSTPKKWGIMQANAIGIIDEDYNGNDDVWQFPCVAFRDTFIPKGTRICQFKLFDKGEPVNFIPCVDLGNENRGGIGSTGD